MNWDDAVVCALALPGAELSTSYGQPAVKVNGHAFLNVGHEPDTSFILRLDLPLTEMLMDAHRTPSGRQDITRAMPRSLSATTRGTTRWSAR